MGQREGDRRDLPPQNPPQRGETRRKDPKKGPRAVPEEGPPPRLPRGPRAPPPLSIGGVDFRNSGGRVPEMP